MLREPDSEFVTMKTAEGHVMVQPFVYLSLIGIVGINCLGFRDGQLMEGGLEVVCRQSR